MKLHLVSATALVAATCLLALPAAAATVFDQGPPRNDGGVRSVFENVNDFTLSTTSTLTGATFYIANSNLGRATPRLTYTLYADALGTPGALLQSGTVGVRQTDHGLPAFAGVGFLRLESWAFDFTSAVTALAATRYWVGVQLGEDFPLATLDGPNPGASAMIRLGVFAPREPGLAFSLQGSAAAVSGTVPEPATWATMVVGFGAIGAGLRRGRRARAVRVRFA